MIARRSLIAGAAALSLPFLITRRAFGLTIINSIGTGLGRDFIHIQDWLNTLPSGPDGNTYWGQLYNDSEFNEFVTFDGHAALPIIMSPAPGQGFRDNVNVRNHPLYYNQANGVGLFSATDRGPPNYGLVVILGDTNVTISGMQFHMGGSGRGPCISSFSVGSTTRIIVNDCIFLSENTTAVLNTAYTTYNNCAFIDNDTNSLSYMIEVSGPTISNYWNFCTLISTGGILGCFDVNPGGFPTAENCAVFGFTNTGAGVFTSCMTDVASPPSGFTGGKVYANQFVNVTNDFREKVGADLRGAGVSDPTNGAFDISGLARPQPGFGSGWDIGAWQLPSSLGAGRGRLLR